LPTRYSSILFSYPQIIKTNIMLIVLRERLIAWKTFLEKNSGWNLLERQGDGLQKNNLLKLFERLGKWRLCLIIFVIIYALLLLLFLDNMSAQWDEASHLNTGLMLLKGQWSNYLNSGLFYPPLYDLAIAGSFSVIGASLFAARVVSVIFGLLSVWLLFELVNPLYGAKIAFISAIVLSIMPGFVWLSRLSMIETMLLFFFLLSMLFFYKWTRTISIKYILFSGIALGFGFLAKYQAIVGILIVMISLLIIDNAQKKEKLKALVVLILIFILIAIPWFLFTYGAYASGTFNQWIYALQMGNPQKSVYSLSFPAPVFYLIALTWPYGFYGFAPVSIFIYIFALFGLILFGLRRKKKDNFLLIWFFAAYSFFTLVGNKDWRYIIFVFPVLAVAASNIIDSCFSRYLKNKLTFKKGFKGKYVSLLLIFFVVFSLSWNCVDSTLWMAYKGRQSLPIEEAANYASNVLGANESLLVVCPFNLLSEGIANFYLQRNHKDNQVLQYPELPVDTYQLDFNITKLISICEQKNVKFLLTPDRESTFPFFNTTMTMISVYDSLDSTGRFEIKHNFGSSPYRIHLISFKNNPDSAKI
jgi:hypothetical protein